MSRHFFITLIVLLLASTLYPQFNQQAAYYEGIGEAEEIEEAKKLALADLSRSIEIFISSIFETIQEEDSAITKDFVKSQIKTYSSICLRNVEFYKKRKGKMWIVIARVPKKEMQKVFEERKLNIRTMLNTAINAELSGDISTALKNYYWSYIMTYSYPDTIIVAFPPDYSKGNAKTLLANKINSVFKNIKCKIRKSYVDGEDFVLVLEFSYNGKPISDMQFYYYNGSEQDWGEVTNGRAYVVLNGEFSGISKKMCLEVEYRFESEMPQNREVYFIYQAIKFPEFDNSVTVPVDLSKYVRIDFNATIKDNVVTFSPILKHISISSIRWDFGDGETSTILAPIHTYPEPGVYIVTLEVNNNQDLMLAKKINLINKTLESIEKKQEPAISTEKISSKNDQSCIKQLMNSKAIEEFLRAARELSRDGKIVFGSSKDFENKEGLYCFVFDREKSQLETVYLYSKESYINIKSGEKISSLSEKYKGRKMAAIWVEVIDRGDSR